MSVSARTAVYAQVDSASAFTVYGGVYESHERLHEPYDNILKAVAK